MIPRRAWVLLLALLAFAAPAAADPTFPKLTGRVVDAANILPPAVRADLAAKSAGLEQRTKAQLVVATIPDLQGYEIDEFGYQLGRAWGIGRAGANDGVLLIVAPNERRVRIEVGYGLEPVLTDALSGRIIRGAILPRFKAGDLPGGVTAGVDAIVAQLGLPPDQARAAAQAAEAQQAAAGRQGEGGASLGFGTIFWIVVILLWVVFSARGRGRRGRRYGRAPIVVWGPGLGGWGGGGGSGWRGGGGGFSGGGGSFGGGGSSGGW